MDSNTPYQHIVLFEEAGQRLDNFLFRITKNIPKSHIYRMIRVGKINLNKKKTLVSYKLMPGDILYIPPMHLIKSKPTINTSFLEQINKKIEILMEDEYIILINKPSGIAVHGGSGISLGIIESMRLFRPYIKFLELAHRLDRDTSGILLLAKKRTALLHLHNQFRSGLIEKKYYAIVHGKFLSYNQTKSIEFPLLKYHLGNERRVCVSNQGSKSQTLIRCIKTDTKGRWTIVEAQLKTGRTHQIRVHLQHSGHAIVGDTKYGNFNLDNTLKSKRLMLHAYCVIFTHPHTFKQISLKTTLPREFLSFFKEDT